MSALRSLVRDRSFGLLWAAHALVSFADAAISFALLLAAYRLTGSAAGVALVAISIALPQLLVALPAGALVDRWDRRRVMVASDLVRGILVLGFPAVLATDLPWLLYLIAFAQASVGTFFNPARGALLPELVQAQRLLQANSLLEMTRVVAGVAGVAGVGVVAGATGGFGGVFFIGSGMFLASALLIFRLRATVDGRPSARLVEPVWGAVMDGIRLVLGSRVLVGVIVAASVVMLGLGAVNVLLVPFVVDDLGASEGWFGALRGAQVLSMVLAGGMLALLAARVRATALVSTGLMGLGVIVAGMAASQHPWHLMALLFGAGWLITPVQASITTVIQTNVPAESLGRAHASLGAIVSAASLTSMAIAGAAAEAVGIRVVLVAAGVLAVAAGVASAAVFRSASPTPRPDRGERRGTFAARDAAWREKVEVVKNEDRAGGEVPLAPVE